MNALSTHFIYAFKKAWADKKATLLRLGQFIIITFILSAVFGSSFKLQNFDKVKVGYTAATSSEAVNTYFEQLAGNEAIAKVVTFEKINTFDEGKKKVQDDELGALIFAPEEFEDQVMTDGKTAKLEVYSQKYSGINYIVVSSVVKAFNNGANANWAAQSIGAQLDPSILDGNPLTEESVNPDRQMDALVYYSVAMLLFMLLFGSEYGSFGIHEEYLGTMRQRSRLARHKQWQMIVGKLAAYSLVVLFTAGVFILMSSLLFGLNWGPNLLYVLMICYLFGAFSIALGMAFMALTQDMKKTTTLIQVSTIGLTLLAGGFVATKFGGFEKISPSLYARDALFAAILNDQPDTMWRNTLILLVLTVILIVISAVASLRRKA